MYVTKAEREYARSLAYLRDAQAGLACARRLGAKDEIRQFEAHVKRFLAYAGNAQDWVLRQRKRDPGSVFSRALSIPFTFDVRS